MANAKAPLAKMPSFTPQQLAWLRGHFYEEIGQEDTIDTNKMLRQAGVNSVILKIESQAALSVKRLRGKEDHLVIPKGG